jgi:hypothetical protein
MRGHIMLSLRCILIAASSFGEQISPHTVSPMPLAEGCTVCFKCALCLCQPTSKSRTCDWRLRSTTIHSCLSSGINTIWQKFQEQCTCSDIAYMLSISPILSRVNSATVHAYIYNDMCERVIVDISSSPTPWHANHHHDQLLRFQECSHPSCVGSAGRNYVMNIAGREIQQEFVGLCCWIV